MTIDLKKIEELANAATQGERKLVGHSWAETSVYLGSSCATIWTNSIEGEATEENQEQLETQAMSDARFIAACDPQTIKQLIALAKKGL